MYRLTFDKNKNCSRWQSVIPTQNHVRKESGLGGAHEKFENRFRKFLAIQETDLHTDFHTFRTKMVADISYWQSDRMKVWHNDWILFLLQIFAPRRPKRMQNYSILFLKEIVRKWCLRNFGLIKRSKINCIGFQSLQVLWGNKVPPKIPYYFYQNL